MRPKTGEVETTRRRGLISRGYFGIGIQNGKCAANVGTLWRTAHIFGAAFMFTVGQRYRPQNSDTMKSWRHIPLFQYDSFDEFYAAMPYDCPLVGVELDERATALDAFQHPIRCMYLLGAEDHGVSKEARARCHRLVQLPGDHCLNVAVAGSIVLFHRAMQRGAA